MCFNNVKNLFIDTVFKKVLENLKSVNRFDIVYDEINNEDMCF